MVIALIVTVAACGAEPPPSTPAAVAPTTTGHEPPDAEQTVTVDGRERSFVVNAPAAAPAGDRLPVVIVLHGGGSDARAAMAQTGMSELAARAGFLAVYPQGTARFGGRQLTWNAGACCGYAVDQQVDDVAFLAAVIDQVVRDHQGDPDRIYLTGFSNGAMLAYRAACQLADRIAAIAPVAGSLLVDCRPSAPLSVLIVHGTADQQIPYQGGESPARADTHPRRDPPVADTTAFWATHNHCSTPTTEQMSPNTTLRHHDCPDGIEVALYTIDGGDHDWPGGRSARGGATPESFAASPLIWDFFQQHTRTT